MKSFNDAGVTVIPQSTTIAKTKEEVERLIECNYTKPGMYLTARGSSLVVEGQNFFRVYTWAGSVERCILHYTIPTIVDERKP